MSQLRVNFLHMCDTAFISQNGTLNIIGIFENINAETLPAVHTRMTAVVNISGTKGTHKIKLRLIGPSDTDAIPSTEGTYPIHDEKQKIGIIQEIINAKFTVEGIYRLVVYSNEQELGKTEFEVKKV